MVNTHGLAAKMLVQPPRAENFQGSLLNQSQSWIIKQPAGQSQSLRSMSELHGFNFKHYLTL